MDIGAATQVVMEVAEYNSNDAKKARLESTLSALLQDTMVADVPKKPSLKDVDILISLELGGAMRISVLKLDGSSFGGEYGPTFVYPILT